MNNRKILIIGAGMIGHIEAHLQRLHPHVGQLIAVNNEQTEALLSLIKERDSLNDLFAKMNGNNEYKLSELMEKEVANGLQLKNQIEQISTATALSFRDVCDYLKAMIQAERNEINAKSIKDIDFKEINVMAFKKEPRRYFGDPKVEQFQQKNLGAKVGGRKHKKNPFRKGGNKW